LDQLFLIAQLLLNATVVAVEQLLRTVEWSAAVVVWEYLEVSIDDIVASIDIDW
jgi:hypothetical protein